MLVTFVDELKSWSQMLPLTYTRPVSDLRVGILKVHEKWARHLQQEETFFITKDYLSQKFLPPKERTLCIKSGLLPNTGLVNAIQSLSTNDVLVSDGHLLAGHFEPDEPFEIASRKQVEFNEFQLLTYPWDIFSLNSEEIKNDFELITKGRDSQKVNDPHTIVYGDQLFLEEGASVKAAILNTESGPIYLGKNAEVQEGAIIKGPFSLGENSAVHLGAKIKPGTTVGPHSKVGGEVSNSILQGYSNKGHDGFLGNAVIGEWCNLGADTNNSNLKNNYASVKMWDFDTARFKDTGLQFCGLIMGDHSKCGINTMFNTGTTIGVSANIFGDGFPRNFIPSYAWGGSSGFSTYSTKKAFETAEIVMKRRGISLSEEDKAILSSVFDYTSEFRVWEKNRK